MSYISLCCLGGGSGRRDVCWCSKICRICLKEVKLIRLLGRSGKNWHSSVYCVNISPDESRGYIGFRSVAPPPPPPPP